MSVKSMRTAAICGAMLLCTTFVQAQDLMITGVFDATLPGGEPKFAELYAINDIPDLSLYAMSRAGNGAGFDAFSANSVLPAISLSAGDFYYAVGNSFGDQTAVFDTVLPGKPRALNFGVNSNGDDVTGLFFNPTGDYLGAGAVSISLIDVVGELGVDGSGEAWEHLDSYIYSNDGRTPSTTFDVSEWMVPGINVLDNLDAAGIAAAIPDGTFVIPEPTSIALMVAGFFGMGALRKRS